MEFYEWSEKEVGPLGTLRVGDTVLWRGGWGTEQPKLVAVEALEVTEYPCEKFGRDVEEVPWSLVAEDRVLFHLSNGHWCYSYQVSPSRELASLLA
jgi:hypothetical protein